jgi:hypothetical protein
VIEGTIFLHRHERALDVADRATPAALTVQPSRRRRVIVKGIFSIAMGGNAGRGRRPSPQRKN